MREKSVHADDSSAAPAESGVQLLRYQEIGSHEPHAAPCDQSGAGIHHHGEQPLAHADAAFQQAMASAFAPMSTARQPTEGDAGFQTAEAGESPVAIVDDDAMQPLPPDHQVHEWPQIFTTARRDWSEAVHTPPLPATPDDFHVYAADPEPRTFSPTHEQPQWQWQMPPGPASPAHSSTDTPPAAEGNNTHAVCAAPRATIASVLTSRPAQSLMLAVGVIAMGFSVTMLGDWFDVRSPSGVTPASAEQLHSAEAAAPMRQAPMQQAGIPNDEARLEPVMVASSVRLPVGTLIEWAPATSHVDDVRMPPASQPAIADPAPVILGKTDRYRLAALALPADKPDAMTTNPPRHETTSHVQPISPARPRISLDLTLAADQARQVPFPLRIEGLSAPATSRLTIRGLPEHTTLSRGRFVSPGVWQAPLVNFDDLHLSVPPLTAGDFELLIEIRSADAELVASHISLVRVVPKPAAVIRQPAAAHAPIRVSAPPPTDTAPMQAATPARLPPPQHMEQHTTASPPVSAPASPRTTSLALNRKSTSERTSRKTPGLTSRATLTRSSGDGAMLSRLGRTPSRSANSGSTGHSTFDPAAIFDQRKGI